MSVKAWEVLCVANIGANIHTLRGRQVTEQQESWNEQRWKTEGPIIQNQQKKNARKKKAKKEKRLAEHGEETRNAAENRRTGKESGGKKHRLK